MKYKFVSVQKYSVFKPIERVAILMLRLTKSKNMVKSLQVRSKWIKLFQIRELYMCEIGTTCIMALFRISNLFCIYPNFWLTSNSDLIRFSAWINLAVRSSSSNQSLIRAFFARKSTQSDYYSRCRRTLSCLKKSEGPTSSFFFLNLNRF